MANYAFDVIYIDDDPMMTELFNQFINWKYRAWRAYACTDPVLLWKQIRAGELTAKVWIIDIMMPDKDGGEIACAVRERFGADVPVLGYTALELTTLQNDPAYSHSLEHFTQIVRKNEGIARVLALADGMMKNQVAG